MNKALEKTLLAGCSKTLGYKARYRFKAQGTGCTEKPTKRSAWNAKRRTLYRVPWTLSQVVIYVAMTRPVKSASPSRFAGI